MIRANLKSAGGNVVAPTSVTTTNSSMEIVFTDKPSEVIASIVYGNNGVYNSMIHVDSSDAVTITTPSGASAVMSSATASWNNSTLTLSYSATPGSTGTYYGSAYGV